jgi:hypothetical protein
MRAFQSKNQYVPRPCLGLCAIANVQFNPGTADRLSVFAHKQRTNQWFETSPKLTTISKIDACKLAARPAVTFALACPGLLQDNRAAIETFEEKTPWPKQHPQKTTS